MRREMRAADEVVRPESSALEKMLDSADVAGLAAVGRADESDVARGEAEPLDTARLEQRQHLSGRAKEDAQRGVAAAAEQPPSSSTTAASPRCEDSTRAARQFRAWTGGL